MSLVSFLRSCKAQLAKSVQQLHQITFVTGNQSSDMDSVVSAIAYSYFTHCQNTSEKIILPFVNIPEADLSLRRDIQYALSSIGIQSQDLIFADDLKSIPTDTKMQLVLVDHNKLEGENEAIMKNKFHAQVVGIIDHHKDEGLYLNANPRILQTVGSCSTLVLTHLMDTIKKSSIDLSTGRFLVSAILLDTGNLKDTYKTKPEDVNVIMQLKKQVDGLSEDALKKENKTLHKQKRSTEGFSFTDILRKDYKEYVCGKFRAGISSVGGSLADLTAKFGKKEIENSTKKLRDDRQLDLMIIMNSYNDASKKHCRQISVVGKPGVALSTGLVNSVNKPLQLESQLTVLADDIQSFEQVNVAASRKQVAPLVTEFLDSM